MQNFHVAVPADGGALNFSVETPKPDKDNPGKGQGQDKDKWQKSEEGTIGAGETKEFSIEAPYRVVLSLPE